MGTTNELEGELRAVSAGGIDEFRVKASGDEPVLATVAARKRTAEGGVGVPHQVTVIGLHGGAASFGGPWKGILGQFLASPRVRISDLLAELPAIKANFDQPRDYEHRGATSSTRPRLPRPSWSVPLAGSSGSRSTSTPDG